MPDTKAINKVIYGGRVLIDLTGDTVTADKLLAGYKAHGADGNIVNGTCDYDMNTQDANATAAEILSGKKAGVGGQMVTGAMKNNGAVEGTISSKDEEYTVPQGFHDGSGKVKIHADEKAKLVANNIREGVTILGVAGRRLKPLRQAPASRKSFRIPSPGTIIFPRLLFWLSLIRRRRTRREARL